MKKILSFTALAMSMAVYSQCNILGASSLTINQIEKYSVEIPGQCQECYDWSSSTDKIKFETNIKQKDVVLKAVSEGQTTISVSVLTAQGVQQCSKLLEIKSASSEKNSGGVNAEKITCEVGINDFKDVLLNDETISFVLVTASDSYQYKWTVGYANGEKRESTLKLPQFPFIKNNDITSVQVRIQTTACYKELTRVYPLNYWSPPVQQTIPQRIYEHISYDEYIKKN